MNSTSSLQTLARHDADTDSRLIRMAMEQDATKTQLDEGRMAHLAIIQGVIGRMSTNSFALKALAVTLSTGAIAVAGALPKATPLFVLSATLPLGVFWWLDARYLRLERLFRRLYDDVRGGGAVAAFDMNAHRYDAQEPSALRIAVSWSVNAVYLTLLAALLIVALALRS